MKKPFVLIFCNLLFLAAFAQNKYSLADKNAADAKGSSIENVHRELVKELPTDEEKVRAFFMWITENIKYDVNEWTNPSQNFSKQDAVNVFKSKKAVCHGYSELFKSFCDLSDIPCFLVSGYIKRDKEFINEGHTWNVVFVNNKWLPVDATWGAGGINEQRNFIKEFDDKYFLPAPGQFLNDHYAFDPMWQLVTSPVSLKNYKKPGWQHLESGDKYYNYNDTISLWLQHDSTEMRLLSAQRMVRMNPEDPESKKELTYATLNWVQDESMKGSEILSELYPKTKNSQTTATRKKLPETEFNLKLDQAYFHFYKADSVLNTVMVNNSKDRLDVENARKVLKHNMNVIKSERH